MKPAPLNVRGVREITKREQVITYMKKNSTDLLCLQETKIPSSSIEQRDKYMCIYIYIYLCSLHRRQGEQTTMEWVAAIIEELRNTETITFNIVAI